MELRPDYTAAFNLTMFWAVLNEIAILSSGEWSLSKSHRSLVEGYPDQESVGQMIRCFDSTVSWTQMLVWGPIAKGDSPIPLHPEWGCAISKHRDAG